MSAQPDGGLPAGYEVELDITGVAHGGSCVGRHEGRVVFVRHTLPGERVRARVTGSGGGGSYLRADAIEVLTAAPGRVTPPCPHSGPGRCGGCDWQHASLPTQRELKAAVVSEQLSRLAGIEWDVVVERVPLPVPGVPAVTAAPAGGAARAPAVMDQPPAGMSDPEARIAPLAARPGRRPGATGSVRASRPLAAATRRLAVTAPEPGSSPPLPDPYPVPEPTAFPAPAAPAEPAEPAEPTERTERTEPTVTRAAAAETPEPALPAEADDGLGWRTRMRLHTGGGRLGLRAHASHQLIPIEDCPIADVRLGVSRLAARRWTGRAELALAVDSRGHRYAALDDTMRPGSAHHLIERAAGRAWRVDGTGFWQVHPGAPAVLVDAVRAALRPQPGESVLDLYSGVGLFAGALADDVGSAGSVAAVESDAVAVANARRNLQGLAMLTLWEGDVEEVLTTPDTVPDALDLVVLDPPRTGARRAVVDAIAGRRPRAIAYVACDPAALARDVATFAGHGYALTGLRAFDLFPMTHHVECVALLEPGDAPGAGDTRIGRAAP